MGKAIRIVVVLLLCILFISCQSLKMLNSYRRGNSFYIENIDLDGNVVGIDNIVINNITFFSIGFTIYGLKDTASEPKQICKTTIPMRTKNTLNVERKLSEINDSLANYKYLCIQFSNGILKKGTAYSENNDVCIDIEQFGIEKNEEQNKIDENLFNELEQSFSK